MKNCIFYYFAFFFTTVFCQRVVGYYPQWMQSEFPASDIDLTVVTHVNHAFAWPDESGNVLSYTNMFNASVNESIHGEGGKILLSLGGWGNDVGFSSTAASPELRTIFIDNLIDICDTYGYDGIDIDWENPSSSVDRQNLNFLVSEIDSTFYAHNPELLITMAVPISNWAGQWYDFSFLKFYVDYFNAMTYDIHGSWSGHAGHNSPLYPSPQNDLDGSCSTGINYLSNTRGIPEGQLNLGLPFWGKQYNTSDINESFSGEVVDKRYYEIHSIVGNGWTSEWDGVAYCPYLVKDDQSKILTFDDQESIRYKCEYAIERELGGVMIWALGYDRVNGQQELINSINQNYLNIDSQKDETMIVRQFSIRNYPNPFNNNTNIFVYSSISGTIKIQIFSPIGDKVKTLYSGNVDRGKKMFFWNGKNDNDVSVSSGIYFITLESNHYFQIDKMLLIK